MSGPAASRPRPWWSPPALGLVAVMAVGSIVMWIGVPVGLVFLASRIADSSRPGFGPYLLIIVGLPVGMVLVGRLLGAVDRLHARMTGTADDRPVQPVWLKSLRGERGSTRRGGVLDVVMVVSVGLAVAAAAVWFFAFAGSSLPSV